MALGRFIAVIVGGMLLAKSAHCGTGSGGTITQILTQNDGIVMIYFNGAHASPPACAAYPQRWAVNATTPAGQALAAAVTTAYSLHATVYIYGTGACNIDANTESIQWMVYPG